jgi:N utilization substance protein A
MQPAEVEDVILCPMLGRVIVLVRDDQLSLAIGKKGQNVRLASKLVGWDIEVMTQDELDDQLERSVGAFGQIEGVTDDLAESLVSQGFFSFDDLSVIEPDHLQELSGLTPEACEIIVDQAEVESEKEEAETERRKAIEREARRVEKEAAQLDAMTGSSLPDGTPVAPQPVTAPSKEPEETEASTSEGESAVESETEPDSEEESSDETEIKNSEAEVASAPEADGEDGSEEASEQDSPGNS